MDHVAQGMKKLMITLMYGLVVSTRKVGKPHEMTEETKCPEIEHLTHQGKIHESLTQ